MWQDIVAILIVVSAVAFWLRRMLSSKSAGCGSCSAKSEPTRPDAYGSRRELINLNVGTPSAEFDSGKHKAN